MYIYPRGYNYIDKVEYWYNDGKFLFSIWCDAIHESRDELKYYIMHNGATISILYKYDCESIEILNDERFGDYFKVVLKK